MEYSGSNLTEARSDGYESNESNETQTESIPKCENGSDNGQCIGAGVGQCNNNYVWSGEKMQCVRKCEGEESCDKYWREFLVLNAQYILYILCLSVVLCLILYVSLSYCIDKCKFNIRNCCE